MCCSYYQYLAQCYHVETRRLCSAAAADYVVNYYMQDWRPYVYYHYGCELGEGDEIYNADDDIMNNVDVVGIST